LDEGTDTCTVFILNPSTYRIFAAQSTYNATLSVPLSVLGPPHPLSWKQLCSPLEPKEEGGGGGGGPNLDDCRKRLVLYLLCALMHANNDDFHTLQ
jgi:hypothetical protein